MYHSALSAGPMTIEQAHLKLAGSAVNVHMYLYAAGQYLARSYNCFKNCECPSRGDFDKTIFDLFVPGFSGESQI